MIRQLSVKSDKQTQNEQSTFKKYELANTLKASDGWMLINIIFHPFLPIGISCLSGPKGKVLTILFTSFYAICYGEIIREWKRELILFTFIHFSLRLCMIVVCPIWLHFSHISAFRSVEWENIVYLCLLCNVVIGKKKNSFTTFEWNILIASGSLLSIVATLLTNYVQILILNTDINYD